MSSKIKVDTIENVAGSGNVSLGSGHNLVVPGNITGQGTAAITSNATVGGTLGVTGKTTLSDDVGIGTTNPNSKLTSQTASTSTSAFSFATQLNNSYSDNSSIVALGFHNRADVNADGVGAAIALSGASTPAGSGNLIFCIKDTSGIANTVAPSDVKMTIDSNGHVTIPNQPYFAAHMTGNSVYQSRSAGHVFDFNTTVYNVGSHFDTTNHRFTAPVNGKYLFTASFITNDGTPEGRISFYVNGNQNVSNLQFGINGSNKAGGGGTNASAIIQLSASDYVDVRSQSGTTHFYEDNHSSFTGILLS